MGQVICEIRILDGTETMCYYAIWNNTTDKVEEGHPLFDTREAGKLYLDLLPKNSDMRIELNRDFHEITLTTLHEWMKKKLMEA